VRHLTLLIADTEQQTTTGAN